MGEEILMLFEKELKNKTKKADDEALEIAQALALYEAHLEHNE